MAGRIKMPLGMEVGLGLGDFVLDVDAALPPQKGGEAPYFRPCVLWPNGWIDQDGTWHGGGPRSRPHCARWGASIPPPKWDRVPQFSAHFYCGKRAVKWLWCCRSIVANDWMHQDTTWYGGDIVLDGDPAPPCLKWYGPSIFGQSRLWPNGWMD